MERSSKNTGNSICVNVTSAQYLAKKFVSLLSLLRSEQHSIKIYSCKTVNF